MTEATTRPIAIDANEAPLRIGSTYPEPFAARVAGRTKRTLGDIFGLTSFGVNFTHMPPGSSSALRHAHAKEDEFVYILEGTPTLITNAGETLLQPGMCAGFAAGNGDAHHLINRSDSDVVYLEVGTRCADESVDYPDDDLAVQRVDGRWRFSHKDGQPY
ncbi:cupin domain-containing protein [Lysobacter tyrosinilyticus]